MYISWTVDGDSLNQRSATSIIHDDDRRTRFGDMQLLLGARILNYRSKNSTERSGGKVTRWRPIGISLTEKTDQEHSVHSSQISYQAGE
jgi:hypothetical protein